MNENIAAQAFPSILTFTDAGRALVFCFTSHTPSPVVHRSAAVTCVNASLSWTLFFSTRWCIRNDVHFDSRMHAAIKPSHYIGGQYGKESEEEGEERSEEDCEEDPQGLQEEVSLA